VAFILLQSTKQLKPRWLFSKTLFKIVPSSSGVAGFSASVASCYSDRP